VNTLPASLVRYQDALEGAIQADLQPRRRRSRAVRLVVAGATVSALVAILAIVSSRGPSGVQTASAAAIHHAAAALAQTPGTILHVTMTGTQTNPDGSTVSWRDESWQQVDAPYARRQIETDSNGKTESANGAGHEQVYDAATNTIYVSAPETNAFTRETQHLSYRLAPGRRPGTYVLRPKRVGRIPVLAPTISEAQAKGLWKGTAAVVFEFRIGGDGSIPYMTAAVVSASSLPRQRDAAPAPEPDPGSPAFRNQILALLRSGGAHVRGHAMIDGRDTIEIASTDGHTVYYVDADTYAPVELDTTGNGGGVKLRFNVWEELPANGNSGLLSIFAQHPTATVNRDPSAYNAAEKRLFPHG